MTTIIDVAQRAGVSFKTVSRVLNGEAGVRERTKAKVLAAAKDLNYSVNHSARALRSRSPTLVCLMFDNPSRAYAHDLQLGAMMGCQKAGFSLVLETEISNEALDRLAQRKGLLGVIIGAPQADRPRVVKRLEQHEIPLVRIATQLEIGETHYISVDERRAAYEATRYLIDLGHTRIAMIKGPTRQFTPRLRFEGFKDALIEAGLSMADDLCQEGTFGLASGLEIAEAYLSRDDRPTAIFAANDEMAAGCLAAAYKLGIRVPDDLSIVGFDDSPIANVVYPSLTTVRQSTGDMAEKGVELLDMIRRREDSKSRKHVSPHTLIIRDSSGPPPQ